MKKLTTVLLGVATILMAACQKPQKEQEIPVTFVSLDKPSVTLEIGDTFSLTATVQPAEATNKTVLWSSSKAAIASVDETGKVTAISEGTTIITAKAGTKYATCTVSVKRKTIQVESISLNKTQTTIEVGDSETLTATVLPENADNPNVTWSTSDEAIATVSAQGVVTAIAEGTAVIIATAGNKSANCTVIVPHVWVPVENVTLNKASTTIEAGASETLTATVLPANADDPSLTWSSSDEAVATVTDQGVVTAVAEGTAVITATAESKSASCTVTVPHVYVPVESVTLNKTETTIEVGNSETLTATVLPANADNPSVTWTSSDESVATVSSDGLVTAIAEGSATVTAKAGSKSATCEVAVILPKVDVSGVTLNKTSIELTEGETFTLVATVMPDNATDKSVTWTSSATSVASVADGVVKGLSAGTAVITVRTNDGGYEATCEVTVKAAKDAVGGTTDDWNIEDELSDQDLL